MDKVNLDKMALDAKLKEAEKAKHTEIDSLHTEMDRMKTELI
jgi:hypothetical protein